VIEDTPSFQRLAAFAPEVCVIGAGPVGLATALEASARGLRVLVLESGGRRPKRHAVSLSTSESRSPHTHLPPEIASARALGGTSNLWGGRCVPFDPIDFSPRPWLDLPEWPVAADDLTPWLAPACAYLGAGDPVFLEELPGVTADAAFGWEGLERWCNVRRIHWLHREALAERTNLLIALGATALGFDYGGDGRISAVRVHLEAEGPGRIEAGEVVLAAGGNESTRLLLAEQRRRPALFGGPDGPLGRHYMVHLAGRIANITITSPDLHEGLGFHVDHGSYVRRRLVPSAATQEAAQLVNVAFWPVVPSLADPAHRSGALSAAFLALSTDMFGRFLAADAIRRRMVGERPRRRAEHLGNVLRDPVRAATVGPWYLWHAWVTRMRMPGFFIPNPARRYGLMYHAEQRPLPESRLTLGDSADRLGLPRLRIDLRFSDEDAAAVLRAHAELEAWLGRNSLGQLDYLVPEPGRAAALIAEARHGAHQIGTVRMGHERTRAVVDGDCRAFDVPNLHVVSTAVLPTSSQANPTLTAVQLGLRLAARLARPAAPVYQIHLSARAPASASG
jgi:choline dehydrogenase-like flavoprotein